MKKIRLETDALAVESFEPAVAPEPRLRGGVRGALLEETLVPYDCTLHGGYTCEQGTCGCNVDNG